MPATARATSWRIGGGVMVKRGKRADGNAQEQGQGHGHGCRARSVTGKPCPISSVTVKSLYLNEGPKSPCSSGVEVASVLRPYRLIQAIGTLQVRHDFRRQRLFLIEGTAGRRAHQKKRNSDNDEQRGNRAGKPRKEVARTSCR